MVGEDAANMPILDGDDKSIAYIYVQNIKVTNNAQGRIRVDNGDYVTIDAVEVYGVGQAGIHLRDGSEYNIINNTIGPNVTTEHIDVKEGSSYAYIIGNTFNAAGMTDILNGGLSYINLKGNYSETAYNKGKQNGNKYFEKAFEVNTKSAGWEFYNNIHDNKLTFNDEFYGKTSITITLALGKKDKPKMSKTTKEKSLEHWVVKNNTTETTAVSNNVRIPVDANKMCNGDITED